MEQIRRCEWAGPDQIYIDYHDNEWGQPLHDDNKLFEMLILEGMQAGLAWITVLKNGKPFVPLLTTSIPQRSRCMMTQRSKPLWRTPGLSDTGQDQRSYWQRKSIP